MIGGYFNRFLRINLSNNKITEFRVDNSVLVDYVGGTGIGSYLLLKEVPPSIGWMDESNKLILATGPLNALPLAGTGIISIIGKGPMTNFLGASQVNGFFGAYLKLNGIDGLIIEGISNDWCYINIKGGNCFINKADFLEGKSTYETESNIINKIGNENKISVLAIGPAGENLVRFACIEGDKGHIAGHNGLGAVMGSKKLKAIVVEKGQVALPIHSNKDLKKIAKEIYLDANSARGGGTSKFGTSGEYEDCYISGILPIKNYTTNIWVEEYKKFDGRSIRKNYITKVKPCWRCPLHCRTIELDNKIYEEPEYEQNAALSSLIDNRDPSKMIILADLINRMGMDVNETGWILAWLMECYEEGILKKEQLNNLEFNWGNTDSCFRMIKYIANREGIGDILAEGVMRASKELGGADRAVFTKHGASPRTHDHRANWSELLDTCCGNTSTIESTGGDMRYHLFGLERPNAFSWEEVAFYNAKLNGRRQFEDSLAICRFISERFDLVLDIYNIVTGENISIDEALFKGKRIVNTLRLFKIYHNGLTPELEEPSIRYKSIIKDGPLAGVDVGSIFYKMREKYWGLMGWDKKTGKILPKTLKLYGLEKYDYEDKIYT